MHPVIAELEKEHAKKQIPDFMIGDTVDVHVRIIEGEKERIQIFNGVVIAKNKGGINENFTVRRLVAGEGVERIFPIHAPRVEKIEVRRRGRSKRAKLYYLRDRVGKATRLREETRPSRSLGRGRKAAIEK
ncbi:MAG: 50S ribosomal protein L19 [Planctomycetota bacterium]|jgi:large subunit ribosomal protein L19|nr:50S ribosomal protein L19 [Planctomycetota bacterium]